jgi:hypothetical protein
MATEGWHTLFGMTEYLVGMIAIGLWYTRRVAYSPVTNSQERLDKPLNQDV